MASRKSSSIPTSILKRLDNVSTTTSSRDNNSVETTRLSRSPAVKTLSRKMTSPAAGGTTEMIRRPSTNNLDSPTHLSILSRKDNDDSSFKSRKPQAPALKVRQTSPSAGVGTSRRPSPSSMDSAAAIQEYTVSRSYLTDKWCQDVESVNALQPVNGVDRRLWQNPPARNLTDRQGNGTMPLRKVSPLSKETPRSTSKYNQALLPSLLRDPDACAEPDDLFDEYYQDDDYEIVPHNPWQSSRPIVCDPPPPPPRLSKRLVLSTPTKLEMLRPLRSSSSRRRHYGSGGDRNAGGGGGGSNDDGTDELLPYATAATRGPRPITPRSKIPPGFQSHDVMTAKKPTPILVDYEKLIRQATKNENATLAEKHLRNWIVDFCAIGGEPPNGVCYNLVLKAHASTGNAEQAQEVLKLMWEDYEAGNEEALPNKKIYTSVMLAWQHSKNKYVAPERCEQILLEMNRHYESGKAPCCKPDVFAYTCCLHCWADSSRGEVAVQRAEALFDQMMARCNRGDTDLSPDNVAYSNLINCYINADSSKDFSMIQRAETKFWEMVDQYHNGNRKAAPTTRNFNTILAALSKSSSKVAGMHADSMILKWENLVDNANVIIDAPDAYSYSNWLKCWANSPREDAMEMLECAMQHLKQRVHDLKQRMRYPKWNGGVAPFTGTRIDVSAIIDGARLDMIKYTTAINAFARYNKVYHAHDYLLEMASRYQQGEQACKVDIKVFNTVLSAWARFPQARVAVDKAAVLIRRLWELRQVDGRLKPNVQAYNSFLVCCKNSKDPRRALSVLEEMKEFCAASFINAESYSHVLEAWARSKDSTKNTKIRQLEQECMFRFGSVPSFNY